jgi:hypothetical protein
MDVKHSLCKSWFSQDPPEGTIDVSLPLTNTHYIYCTCFITLSPYTVYIEYLHLTTIWRTQTESARLTSTRGSLDRCLTWRGPVWPGRQFMRIPVSIEQSCIKSFPCKSRVNLYGWQPSSSSRSRGVRGQRKGGAEENGRVPYASPYPSYAYFCFNAT